MLRSKKNRLYCKLRFENQSEKNEFFNRNPLGLTKGLLKKIVLSMNSS